MTSQNCIALSEKFRQTEFFGLSFRGHFKNSHTKISLPPLPIMIHRVFGKDSRKFKDVGESWLEKRTEENCNGAYLYSSTQSG